MGTRGSPIALRFSVGLFHQSSLLRAGADHRVVRGQAQQLGHGTRQLVTLLSESRVEERRGGKDRSVAVFFGFWKKN